MPDRVIDHLVVLMLENRSFDHLFGYRSGVDGLRGTERNLLDPTRPESDVNPAFIVDNGAPYAISAGQGPGHSINATNVLRHTFASICAQRRVALRKIGEWMGHSTTKVTELYAHLCAYDADIDLMCGDDASYDLEAQRPALRIVK